MLTIGADELGSFRVPRYRLGLQWLKEYNKHFPISEPQDDFDDRNLIYSMQAFPSSLSSLKMEFDTDTMAATPTSAHRRCILVISLSGSSEQAPSSSSFFAYERAYH